MQVVPQPGLLASHNPNSSGTFKMLSPYGVAWSVLVVRTIEIEEPIVDSVHLEKNISWRRDGVRYLFDSLRKAREDLVQVNYSTFAEVRRSILDARTKDYVEGLAREVGYDR